MSKSKAVRVTWDVVLNVVKYLGSCGAASRWLRKQKRLGYSPKEAWDKCRNSNWMLWFADSLYHELKPPDGNCPQARVESRSPLKPERRIAIVKEISPWTTLSRRITEVYKRCGKE